MFHTEVGRWQTRDPLGSLDGLNLYQFLRSSPLESADPFGTTTHIATTATGLGPVAMAPSRERYFRCCPNFEVTNPSSPLGTFPLIGTLAAPLVLLNQFGHENLRLGIAPSTLPIYFRPRCGECVLPTGDDCKLEGAVSLSLEISCNFCDGACPGCQDDGWARPQNHSFYTPQFQFAFCMAWHNTSDCDGPMQQPGDGPFWTSSDPGGFYLPPSGGSAVGVEWGDLTGTIVNPPQEGPIRFAPCGGAYSNTWTVSSHDGAWTLEGSLTMNCGSCGG